MAKAICVEPKKVDLIWPEVSPWIRRAMERADLGTFESVQDDVLNGRSLLWLAFVWPNIEGAAISQIGLTEKSKVCTIVACGGKNGGRWLHLIEAIEYYARAEGCHRTSILGRRGWSRVLPKYKQTRVILERQL